MLLSTSSLNGYGLHRIFAFAKKAGYDGLNLDLSTTDYDTESPVYIRELIDAYELPVVGITAYERRMNARTVDRVIEYAQVLGAKIISFYPPHRLDKDGEWFTEYLPKLKSKKGDEHAPLLSVVNVEPKTFLFFIPEYKDATLTSIKKITGVTTLAISNVDIESGVDLLKTFSLMGNSIHNVFLSDKTGNREGIFPGKGDMPLESLLIKLRENGYAGLFTLKVAPKELAVGGDPEEVNKRLVDARKFFEKYFKADNGR
jgi:sugar phosphate isomerase/epimerase